MAYPFNRGTKDDPKWSCRYKDTEGKWRMVAIDDTVRTKKEAQKWCDAKQEDVDAGKPDPRTAKTCGELMDLWINSLTNRDTKNDKIRHRKHLVPKFGKMRLAEITLKEIMTWIDELRAVSARERLAEGTMRQLFNLLSRFFSWAIERGHTDVNPCRMVPNGKRPQGAPKSAERPWIKDDKTVRDLMNLHKTPFREMFYLSNRCGMRPGEVRGLRMSDLAFLESEGSIRIRYSDAGPLKEDKSRKSGPSSPKWAPAPLDFDAVVGEIVAQRTAEGAGPEDFVFAPKLARSTLKYYMEEQWRVAAETLRIPHQAYEAGRHSFASRNLDANVPTEHISAAMGHASVRTTERFYAHVIRKTFAANNPLRAGLATKAPEGEGGKMLPFVAAKD